MPRTIRRRAAGQSLILLAIILPFLVALIMTALEISARLLERAAIEDALQQATRSSVQTFDYAAFAGGGQRVRVESTDTVVTGCDHLLAGSVRAVACRTLLTNLTGVRGLAETPEQLAARVRWTFLPNGGTCSSGGHSISVTAPTPLVCATVQARMTGLLGWGVWTPQIDAADTLDPITNVN